MVYCCQVTQSIPVMCTQSERGSLQCVVSCTQPRMLYLFYIVFFLQILEVTEANPSGWLYVLLYRIDESRNDPYRGGGRRQDTRGSTFFSHSSLDIQYVRTFAVRHLLASFSCNHLWQFGLVALGNALCALLAWCIIIYMVRGDDYKLLWNIRRTSDPCHRRTSVKH